MIQFRCALASSCTEVLVKHERLPSTCEAQVPVATASAVPWITTATVVRQSGGFGEETVMLLRRRPGVERNVLLDSTLGFSGSAADVQLEGRTDPLLSD